MQAPIPDPGHPVDEPPGEAVALPPAEPPRHPPAEDGGFVVHPDVGPPGDLPDADVKGSGKKGRGKGAGPAWPTWQVTDTDDVYLGVIKYGEVDQILSAHCMYRVPGEEQSRHGLCRVNRTVTPNDKRAAGALAKERPLRPGEPSEPVLFH